ncbi:hypothetical protein ASPCAL06965 [Aspergillus calidoustus]|uniref:Uncharacterized protein n=1 Tax=Aspergillus calidoustus TaxID=454130 RepID=A0A0U5G4L6_ASPCI|nr:hypothetical protein ASPCAL06965 [Aspergillus calidoustus]
MSGSPHCATAGPPAARDPNGSSRHVPWSIQGLPTTSRLAAEVHATACAQEILSKEIKNILATPVDTALDRTQRDPREAERNGPGENKPPSNLRRGSDTIENASHRCETTPSGDLTLLTPDQQRTEHLIAH